MTTTAAAWRHVETVSFDPDTCRSCWADNDRTPRDICTAATPDRSKPSDDASADGEPTRCECGHALEAVR